MFSFSIVLAIAGSVLYNVFQKMIAPAVNPLVSLLITYSMALALTAAALLAQPARASLPEALRQANWASFALGGAIVVLELGFLLAFRSGWNISLAALASQSATAILLVPIGLLAFKERITGMNIAGMAVCLAGLILMNLKRFDNPSGIVL
jgi:drug/metabolite transporter (DMT)-like permease